MRTSGGRCCSCGRVVSDHHSSASAAPLEAASLGVGGTPTFQKWHRRDQLAILRDGFFCLISPFIDYHQKLKKRVYIHLMLHELINSLIAIELSHFIFVIICCTHLCFYLSCSWRPLSEQTLIVEDLFQLWDFSLLFLYINYVLYLHSPVSSLVWCRFPYLWQLLPFPLMLLKWYCKAQILEKLPLS